MFSKHLVIKKELIIVLKHHCFFGRRGPQSSGVLEMLQDAKKGFRRERFTIHLQRSMIIGSEILHITEKFSQGFFAVMLLWCHNPSQAFCCISWNKAVTCSLNQRCCVKWISHIGRAILEYLCKVKVSKEKMPSRFSTLVSVMRECFFFRRSYLLRDKENHINKIRDLGSGRPTRTHFFKVPGGD